MLAGGVAGTGVAYPGLVEGGDEGLLPPAAQTPEAEPPVQPMPPGGDDGGGIPGLGVPYRDFIPTLPMVKDPATGQWRNAYESEGGYTPDPEADQTPPPGDTEDPGSQAQEVSPLQFGNTGNFQNAPDPNAPPPEYPSQEEVPPLQFGNTGNFQNAPAEPPVVEQQPAPAPAPPYDPANGVPQPDGDGDGIPNEYGDGPDLDANGIPDEIGINPDSLQPGYADPSTSGEWGGVGVPDPTVVPQSDAATSAEAMPEEYGDGSGVDGNWVPDETGIDPYALQQPAYADPDTSGDDGTGDPYAGSSDPYGSAPEEAPPDEAPISEVEDPDALGSF